MSKIEKIKKVIKIRINEIENLLDEESYLMGYKDYIDFLENRKKFEYLELDEEVETDKLQMLRNIFFEVEKIEKEGENNES